MSETPIIDEHSEIIKNNEQRFAFVLAGRVISRPKLSIWMILIPVIFVYFFYQFNKYKQGRADFTDNYLITRKRALNAARVAVLENRDPNLEETVKLAKLPPETLNAYRELLVVLVQHYTDLLRAEGEDIAGLVKSAYRTRTNYLLFCNRLNQVERGLNAALRPHMRESTDGFDDVVRKIEEVSIELRRQEVDLIFS
jgi:hypothetical protein